MNSKASNSKEPKVVFLHPEMQKPIIPVFKALLSAVVFLFFIIMSLQNNNLFLTEIVVCMSIIGLVVLPELISKK